MSEAHLDVLLSEWQRKGPFPLSPRLRELLGPGTHGPGLAAVLGDKLQLTCGFSGLEVSSTSYVGRIEYGPLRVSIDPKIATTTLTRMLRYVYGLTDLWQPDLPTSVSVDQHGLQDILVELLVRELENLWRGGMPRVSRPRSDRVDAIRGRIDARALASKGVLIEALIPCTFFERSPDWHLNQVLLAGLRLARRVCQQPQLARRTERMARALEAGVKEPPVLTHADVTWARIALTRLTGNAAPALELIDLLLEGSGLAVKGPRELESTAFLFDMNMFYQRFLSRFLREHAEGMRVADEHTIRGLYRLSTTDETLKKRRPPAPRPDFALFGRDGSLRMYMDAKYRDLWNKSLPPSWMYQLTAYALASPNQVSILLYPTISKAAHEEEIAIHDPVSDKLLGHVMLRPVDLELLGQLVGSSRNEDRDQCAVIAKRLINCKA